MLNPQQFNQGELFTPLDTVINDYDKADAVGHTQGEADEWSPREQWERPLSRNFSLRDLKLKDRRNLRKGMTYEKLAKGEDWDTERYGPVKPPVVHHRWGNARPALEDGHHRLAQMEAAGHTEIPVEHAGQPYDKDFYDPKKRWGS
jgi:hypothetical protein